MASAPPERIVQPQVTPGGSAPFGGASPDAFGASVGEGMSRLGGTLEQAGLQAYKLDLEKRYQNDLAAASNQATQFRLAAREKALAMEQAPAPGGAGHAAGFEAYYNAGKDALLQNIQNPRIRQHIEGQLDNDGADMQIRADEFEAGQRGIQWAQDVHEHQTFSGNVVRLTPTRDTLVNEVASLDEVIDAGPGTPEHKRQLKDETRNQFSMAYIQALPPEQAKAELASGYLSTWLPAHASEQLDKGADAEQRRQASEARAALAQQRAQVTGAVELARARKAGGVVLGDDELSTLQQGAAAVGLAKDVFDVGQWRVQNNVNRETAVWKPQQYDAAIAAIEAIPPEKRSDVQAVTLDQLEHIRDKRVQEFNNNPGLRAAKLGNPDPGLDWTDPASRQRHVQWAYGVAQDTGVPPPLVPEQDRLVIRQLIAQGTDGQSRASAQLALLGPQAGFEAARQIAPNDHVFQMSVALPHDARALALAGREAVKGNPELAKEADLQPQFQQIEAAARGADPAYIRAAKDATMAILAQLEVQQGKSTFQRSMADQAMNLAMGATVQGGRSVGGVGAANGSPVRLPDTWAQQDFDQHYYNLRGTSMVWGDGRHITFDELRGAYYRLKKVGDYDYRWLDPMGREMSDQAGRPVTLHLNRVPPRGAAPKLEGATWMVNHPTGF